MSLEDEIKMWDTSKNITKDMLKEIYKKYASTTFLELESLLKLEEKMKFPQKFPSSSFAELEENGEELDDYWTPKGQPRTKISQMSTKHLFYSLRFLYNKSVPIEFRTKEAYTDILKPRFTEYTKKVLQIMFYQIGKREDLTVEMLEQLAYMAKIVREHL